MSAPHSVHELQEGLGQTGMFGEFFIVLGILIFIGGGVLAWVGHSGMLHDSMTGFSESGNSDAVQVGWLFFFEGLGFTVFGAMVMLAGWGRHHGEVT